MHLKSYLYGLISLGFIQLKSSSADPSYDRCLRCEDFNRLNLIPCANSYKDCGLCKPGFIEDEEDPRICYTIEILEHPPETITKSPESEVYLTCKFNTKVHCVWERNGQHVAIGGHSRYQFHDEIANRNQKVHDCSININRLSNNDVGQWQCSNAADSFTNSIKSEESFISIAYENPWIEFNGENVTGSEIPIPNSYISSRLKRGTTDHNDRIITCLVAHTATELTWRLDDTTVQKERDSVKNELDLNDIKSNNFSEAKLDCIAKYSRDIEEISSVILRKTNAQQITPPSSILRDDQDPQSFFSEIEPTIRKSFLYANSSIPNWLTPIVVIMLIVTCLFCLVLIVFVIFALKCLKIGGNRSPKQDNCSAELDNCSTKLVSRSK